MLRFTVNDWLYSKRLGAQMTYDEYLLLYANQRASVEVVVNAWIGQFKRNAQKAYRQRKH